jgi:hypothetical protein
MATYDRDEQGGLYDRTSPELIKKLNAQGIWVTKAGERVPVTGMSDAHLRAVMGMLSRWAIHALATAPEPDPDSDGWFGDEDGQGEYFQEEVEEYMIDEYPIYKHIKAEAGRRDLLDVQ